MGINEKFDKYLYDELGAYRTVPDNGNRTIEISSSFQIANEAFEKLDIKTIKLMVINQLKLMRIEMIKRIDDAIKSVEGFDTKLCGGNNA